jgi:hypothetical protein
LGKTEIAAPSVRIAMPFVAVRESLHENDNSKRTDNVGFLG